MNFLTSHHYPNKNEPVGAYLITLLVFWWLSFYCKEQSILVNRFQEKFHGWRPAYSCYLFNIRLWSLHRHNEWIIKWHFFRDVDSAGMEQGAKGSHLYQCFLPLIGVTKRIPRWWRWWVSNNWRGAEEETFTKNHLFSCHVVSVFLATEVYVPDSVIITVVMTVSFVPPNQFSDSCSCLQGT